MHSYWIIQENVIANFIKRSKNNFTIYSITMNPEY